jgi:hypothetical protein
MYDKIYPPLPPISSRDEITAIVAANALAQPLPLERLVVALDRAAADLERLGDKLPEAAR